MIIILNDCSNYLVQRGYVFLINGIKNVKIMFVLEGKIKGRNN
jgi:hypothetical protein